MATSWLGEGVDDLNTSQVEMQLKLNINVTQVKVVKTTGSCSTGQNGCLVPGD